MEECILTAGFNAIDDSMNDDASGLEAIRPKPWEICYLSQTIWGFGLQLPKSSDGCVDEDEYYAKHPKKKK